MGDRKKKKVLMYYSFGDKVGGPLTYIKTIINSNLNEKYDFVECYQNMSAGGINFKLLKNMVEKIKKENPDIVHVHGLQSEGFYGVLAAKIAGCKNVITTVHGFAFDSQQSTFMKRKLYQFLVEPCTLMLSRQVYCVCQYALNRKIMRHFKKKSKYIYTSTPEPSINEKREFVRKRLKIGHEDVVFVISGRISKEKGFDVLLEAIKILINQKSNIKLLVVGDGDYKEDFFEKVDREHLSKYIIMVGQTDKVFDYLNAADVCVLPSFHENLPISLLEAGTVGLPCIVSDVGGIPEIILDKKTGFIIKGWNANDYASKMLVLCENKMILDRMRENIISDMKERFSIESMCRQIGELYEGK